MVQSKNLNATTPPDQTVQSVQTVILAGPTAVGKSDLAIRFALDQQSRSATAIEIINADSVCFYQHFNIGSAKPSREDLKLVPHHLINVAQPNDIYDASKFLEAVAQKLTEIHQRGKRAIIVGGSGFYLKALRYGLWDAPATDLVFRRTLDDLPTPTLFERLMNHDPIHAKKIGSADRYRIIRALEIIHGSGGITPTEMQQQMNKTPDARFQLWTVDRERSELETRMVDRIQKMLDQGFINEVQSLKEKYPKSKTLHAIGYQQVLDFLDSKLPSGRKIRDGLLGLKDEIALAHRQLAKQQRTWFNGLKPERTFLLPAHQEQLQVELITHYQ
jgi:tRNA dimethylallyltransferase